MSVSSSHAASSSWHKDYKSSPFVFIGGLAYELTEGDIICAFSQWGEVFHINLIRDRKSGELSVKFRRIKCTGKSKGFCYLGYEDQRSTNLAVDNMNGSPVP